MSVLHLQKLKTAFKLTTPFLGDTEIFKSDRP